ncbi:hypothetical protein ETAC_11330 [Edwardsiella piscicida C07-087]|nr:hypothetical protein ETAC_11330 [Edwardsiella piscicida C07-087]
MRGTIWPRAANAPSINGVASKYPPAGGHGIQELALGVAGSTLNHAGSQQRALALRHVCHCPSLPAGECAAVSPPVMVFARPRTAMALLNTGAMSAGVSDMEGFLPFLTDGGLKAGLEYR